MSESTPLYAGAATADKSAYDPRPYQQAPYNPHAPQQQPQQQPYAGANPYYAPVYPQQQQGIVSNDVNDGDFVTAIIVLLIGLLFFPLLLIINVKFLKSKNDGARIIAYISLLLFVFQLLALGLSVLALIPFFVLVFFQVIAILISANSHRK